MNRERRESYRVSVKPTSGLALSMQVSGRQWEAVAGNISADGIFLRLDPDAPVELPIDSKVDVEITFAGETIQLRGVVRSRRSGGYGVLFPERIDENFINPLDQLGRIWAELQRDILSTRVLRKLE